MAEQQLPPISYAEWSLATPLKLSQTVDGSTFTLTRAYADAHRITLNISFSGYQDNVELFYQPHLTDNAHVEFKPGAHSLGSEDVSIGFEVPPDFAPSNQLDLHLKISVDVIDLRREEGNRMRHAGPFTFDFSVPFHPARVVTVNQTLTEQGSALSLSKVSRAPSGVCVYLTLPLPVADITHMMMRGRIKLEVADASPFGYHGSLFVFSHIGEAHCSISDLHFDEAPLYKQQGEWTLKVDGLQYRDMLQPMSLPPGTRTEPHNGMVGARGWWVPSGAPMPLIPGYTAIPGAWVFKFTVPPGTD